jgi:hypothetical protein
MTPGPRRPQRPFESHPVPCRHPWRRHTSHPRAKHPDAYQMARRMPRQVRGGQPRWRVPLAERTAKKTAVEGERGRGQRHAGQAPGPHASHHRDQPGRPERERTTGPRGPAIGWGARPLALPRIPPDRRPPTVPRDASCYPRALYQTHGPASGEPVGQ